MCQSIILSKKGKTTISYCLQCKSTHIWHNNLILQFSRTRFLAFKKYVTSAGFDEECFLPFPDGEDRLVLHTPNSDINFTFTEEEWECFYAAMEETVYLQEVYELIHH